MKTLALLRGINVGGKNILPMNPLADLFRAAGCTAVQTFIQSGNVVFTAPPGIDIVPAVQQKIAARFNLNVPIVLRTSIELRQTIANNPYLEEAIDTSWLHVMFLQHQPTAVQLAALDPQRSTPDRFIIQGSEVYLHLPNGAAKTKLTNAYFDTRLKTVATQRNWATVLKLAAMMEVA